MDDDMDFGSLYGRQFTPHAFHYGPNLSVIPASRAGKAHTLLADAVFNSSIVLLEWIDRGFLSFCHGKSVLELGAGTALPSLHLLQTPSSAPSKLTITDYSSDEIIQPLQSNVSRNLSNASEATVNVLGLDWANQSDIQRVLQLQNHNCDDGERGFQIVIAADLLWYTDAHTHLIQVMKRCLSYNPSSNNNNQSDDRDPPRILVATGKYVKRAYIEGFLSLAEKNGFKWREIDLDDPFPSQHQGDKIIKWQELRLEEKDREWLGRKEIWWQDLNGDKKELNDEDMRLRKNSVWAFELQWKD